MKHIISLGAGVQSSTMALMAAKGEITPMPDAAVFADTQGEPKAVYRWLDWLELQLPFPVYRVTAGNLFERIGQKRGGGRRYDYMPLPAFVRGEDGKASLLNRSCTHDYKIVPVQRKLRELLGIVRRRSPREAAVTLWIGISSDEVQRAKPSKVNWIAHRWPLLEKRRARLHCLEWMEAQGYPRPPRSACGPCPYHNDAEWLSVRDDPDAWKRALEVDARIRDLKPGKLVAPGIYLHRSLKPLAEVEFKPGEPDLFDERGFAVECEGMCGV